MNVRGGGRTKALLLENSFLETLKFFGNKFNKRNTNKKFKEEGHVTEINEKRSKRFYTD